MSQVIELQSYNYVPIQQSLNRNVVLNKMVGTHFFGSFENVSFEELVEFGLLATIYDYKQKKSIWTDPIEWSVGGHDPRVMDRIYKLTRIDEKMTYHQALVTIEKAMLMMKSRNVPFNYDRLNIAWSKIQRGV